MRVLWITNTIFPAPSREVGRPEPVIGGWMYALAERVAQTPGVELAIATVYGGREIRAMELSGTKYFLLPAQAVRRYQPALESHWRTLCESFKPDLIHMHGTENPHGLACMRARSNIPYVVSVQGLTSINARYHYGGLKPSALLRHTTLRDLAKRDSVICTRRNRERCAPYEHEALRRATVIAGRTAWDRVHVKRIAPSSMYVTCNESLREPFYTSSKWRADGRKQYSIFMSQAHTPLKGLHQVLRAVSILKPDFPELKVRIAGHNILAAQTLRQRLSRTGYGSYIGSLARGLGVDDVLEFIGLLNANRMAAEYRAANAFVCASAVENSPNSIGEAQLIGVPVVAAYVGGVPDMVTHGSTGLLYRFEEVEMLADHLRRLMTDDSFCRALSENQIDAARRRHDAEANHQTMMQVYEHTRRQRA